VVEGESLKVGSLYPLFDLTPFGSKLGPSRREQSRRRGQRLMGKDSSPHDTETSMEDQLVAANIQGDGSAGGSPRPSERLTRPDPSGSSGG
jgi:hypothetical protein